MRSGESRVAWLAAAALAGLVSACAGVPRDASLPIDDPNEQWNRGVLRVNQAVLDPASNVVKTVPAPIRDRLEDLDANLKEPRVLANNILQGRFNAAGITIGRIVFNTTFGLGGLFDVATAGGLPQQSGDFGPLEKSRGCLSHMRFNRGRDRRDLLGTRTESLYQGQVHPRCHGPESPRL